MASFWLIAIIAVVAVGLFALGLSLTLIFRGHNIKSEIGENEHMRERGIKCAIQTMREESGESPAKSCGDAVSDCPPEGCTGCTTAGYADKQK